MQSLYRFLPKVDQILEEDYIEGLIEDNSRSIVVEAIRIAIDELRGLINESIGEDELKDQIGQIESRIKDVIARLKAHNLIKLINASGVVLHTNLGRAAMTKEIMDAMAEVSCGYSNLEYDLETGQRGERYSHVEDIIAQITGAEASLVVNNNAAAVMLALSTLSKDTEVITSRGELVEIGGSFRIPDVCKQSGARLVEVGTTNKTHYSDYEEAITEETSAILKVHTSNYRILGFTGGVSAEELLDLKEKHNLYIIEDLGSGVLVDLSKYGLDHEPTVQESVENGVDLVSFSGDKLLGGPQAGIIVGKKKIIDRLKKNPMTRALRVNKFTIAALETVLRYYMDEEIAIEKIPVLKMLTLSKDELGERAKELLEKIGNVDGLDIEIVETESEVGGGSLPLERLPSYGISIRSDRINENKIEEYLRKWETPIIARVSEARVLLDLRTIFPDEYDIIGQALKSLRC